MAYAYNAQKNVELVPDEDGCYLVNGKKIKCSDFVIAPLQNICLEGGRMFVIAPPFPPPFPIEVTGNGYSLTLMVQRQPINSIDEIKIASVSDSALSVTYTFDSTKEPGTMKFNIQMCQSNSATDTLASKEIFNAFILGEGTLCGIKIAPNEGNQDKMIPAEVLRFWHRIVEVEEKLKVTFDVSKEIALDDIKNVDALHRCFVENLPFKTYLNDSTLRGKGTFDEEAFKKFGIPIGQEILFEYAEERTLEVLGVTVQCYALVDMFGGVVSEIEMPQDGTSGEFFIKLLPAEKKRMYSATQYYIDQESLEAVQVDRSHVDIFQIANELDKY